MVSYICSMYTADSVLLAAIATLSATLGLTYHAMTTKNDYTSWSSSAKGTNKIIQVFFTQSVGLFYLSVSSIYSLLEAA